MVHSKLCLSALLLGSIVLSSCNGSKKSESVSTGAGSDTPTTVNFKGSPFPGFGSNQNHYVNIQYGSSDQLGYSMVLQSDQKLLVAGFDYDGVTGRDAFVMRVNQDGTMDTSFGTNGAWRYTSPGAFTDEFLSMHTYNNTIIASGVTSLASGAINRRALVVRLNNNGTPDSTFSGDGVFIDDLGGEQASLVNSTVLSNGKILAIGRAKHGANFVSVLIKINTDGTLDTTFGTGGRVVLDSSTVGISATAFNVQVDSSNKIIIMYNTKKDPANLFDLKLARLNANGSVDTTFGTNGTVILASNITIYGSALKVASDGIFVGYSYPDTVNKSFIAKFNMNGALNTSFGTNGIFDLEPSLNLGSQIYSLQVSGTQLYGIGKKETGSGSDIFVVSLTRESGVLDSHFGINGFYDPSISGTLVYTTGIISNDAIYALGSRLTVTNNPIFNLIKLE